MIDAVVLDASVAVKWVLDEPGSDKARALSSAVLEAPDFLIVECANILWKKVLVGDLSLEGAMIRLDLLSRAPIALNSTGDLLEPALRLAARLKHPVYDCIYLALAVRREVPLVTADRRFAAAIRRDRKLLRFSLHLDEV